MFATFRHHLNSSRIACIFHAFLGTFTVSDTLLDLLADVSHLGLVSCVHISSSSEED